MYRNTNFDFSKITYKYQKIDQKHQLLEKVEIKWIILEKVDKNSLLHAVRGSLIRQRFAGLLWKS